ncbi:MAG: NapC/NirT family cytochrome c [Acidobacteriota bacterium]
MSKKDKEPIIEDESHPIHATNDGARRPSLFRNFISYAGLAIVAASVTSLVLLLLIEYTSPSENPYTGLITFIAIPTIVVAGLFITLVGIIWERRRRINMTDAQIAAFPVLDLNNPQRRRSLAIFLAVSFIFLFASAFISYRAFEYTESVTFCGQTCHTPMKPEYTAYLAGSHARVRCVDCHVGGGAGWYVRSKLSGAYQLYSVAFNLYPRPITSPVHNLRPAPDTCEQCHWPEKFFGAQMKVFDRYGFDEHNTRRERRMLINVGGGGAKAGQDKGIHWHMNIANEINYIATDDRRQVIPWVRIKDQYGNVTEYNNKFNPLPADQIDATKMRKMDCVDCHNRPAHVYQPPDTAVDDSFTSGSMDPTLPYLKREAVEVLSGSYQTTEEANQAIDTNLTSFYQNRYPDIFTQKQLEIRTAISEVQRIYNTYFFPEMKTDWQTHPNNIGHLHTSGCFRCHDGQHFSDTGKVITNNCTVCHTTIYDSAGPPELNVSMGPFKHPVDLGGLADRKCDTCHSRADKPFTHPINLGDISMFQCVQCHPRK